MAPLASDRETVERVADAASEVGIGLLATLTEQGSNERVVLVNGLLIEWFAPETNEALPSSLWSRLEAADRALVDAWTGDPRSVGGHPLDVEVRERTGKRLVLRAAANRSQTGSGVVRVYFLRDASIRTEARGAAAGARRRIRHFIDSGPLPIAVLSQDRVLYANASALALGGFGSLDELLNVPMSAYLQPENVQRIPQLFQEVTTSDAPIPRLVRMRRPDSSSFPLHFLAMRTVWDGQPAVLCVGRDAPERGEREMQSLQSERLASVGTLAAGVAHEINNPLAYVMLNLQYLLRELPRVENDAGRLGVLQQRLDEARHGAQRVSAIVKDLREFARREKEDFEPVEVTEALGGAIRLASPHFEGHARLDEDYEDAPPVRANARRLEQVFLNLLVNAAQALPTGKHDTNRVVVTVRRDGPDAVVVGVADNGAGIPRELLGRVFDPFFTTKPRGVGTGLGLPICHNIVTGMGGEISVDSEEGTGTRFRVKLLRSTDTLLPAPSKASSVPAPSSNRRARVLVIDDELPVASMLGRLLSESHDVRLTTSAREALELLLGNQGFDVVLCDLLMPGMSGMDLYRQLQSERPGLEHRLVFMTGGAFTPRAAEFLASVRNPRIEKPFDVAQVQKVVRDMARA